MALAVGSFLLEAGMRSKRYRLILMAVKIIDIILNSEYDVDDSLHCKKCCEVCNRKNVKYGVEKDIDTVIVK